MSACNRYCQLCTKTTIVSLVLQKPSKLTSALIDMITAHNTTDMALYVSYDSGDTADCTCGRWDRLLDERMKKYG